MKIRSDQLQVLQEQSETRAKPKAAGGFEALLAEKTGASQGQGAIAAAPVPTSLSASLLSAQLAVQAAGADGEDGTDESMGLGQIAQGVDSLLGNLDAYAERLSQKGGADLRGAYSLLEGMGKELAAIRGGAPDLASRHAGLASVVNELEVLTTTESFKFNRGDYF